MLHSSEINILDDAIFADILTGKIICVIHLKKNEWNEPEFNPLIRAHLK